MLYDNPDLLHNGEFYTSWTKLPGFAPPLVEGPEDSDERPGYNWSSELLRPMSLIL